VIKRFHALNICFLCIARAAFLTCFTFSSTFLPSVVVTASLWVALPAAIGLFPQRMEVCEREWCSQFGISVVLANFVRIVWVGLLCVAWWGEMQGVAFLCSGACDFAGAKLPQFTRQGGALSHSRPVWSCVRISTRLFGILFVFRARLSPLLSSIKVYKIIVRDLNFIFSIVILF
jgi:hypothetical protein